MKQSDAVVTALENLGGIATLGNLNLQTMKIQDCFWKSKTPFASIRRIVQLDKRIYKIKPGLYGLVTHQQKNEANGIVVETQKNMNSAEVQEFNHSYYQGLLLTVGNLKKLATFIPNQDKNKVFIDTKLGHMRTLDAMPNFSYPNFVHRSSTIDVIWFNERKMPHSFFEVEHSTDIQNSLLKFSDLTDFSARMVIVADQIRKSEYDNKIKYSSFKELSACKRITFLDYESLTKQYEQLILQQKFDFLL